MRLITILLFSKNSIMFEWSTDYTLKLQAISKMRLKPDGGVARRLKMLTYYVYAPLFRRLAPCHRTRSIFLRRLVNEAPRSKLRDIKAEFAEANPPFHPP